MAQLVRILHEVNSCIIFQMKSTYVVIDTLTIHISYINAI